MIRETVAMSFESFAGNRLRTVLSLIGVVIGVASVVAVTSLSASGAADVRKRFEAFGLDSVQVFPSWRGGDGPQVRLDDALAADIMRSFPEAKAVLRKTSFGANLARGGRRMQTQVEVVDPRYFSSMNAPVELGAAFTPEDEYRARCVAVLGREVARELFPEGDPVGKTVTFAQDGMVGTLEVVGVLASKQSRYMDDWDRSAYVPFGTASRRFFANLNSGVFCVVARDRSAVVPLGERLKRYFLDRTGDPEAVWISSPKEWAEENEKMIRSLSLLLGGVAAISLLVGGIGIMNIMLVSVVERRREIGIRKALGASRSNIRLQFMVEASVLTAAGGAIGLALGTGIAWLAVRGFGWAFSFSPDAAAIAVAVSVAVGLFSGIYPAVRAARLDPVEALAAE